MTLKICKQKICLQFFQDYLSAMSARLRSPVRDKRIINLAAEVAETKDRGVPGLLLNLRGKISRNVFDHEQIN